VSSFSSWRVPANQVNGLLRKFRFLDLEDYGDSSVAVCMLPWNQTSRCTDHFARQHDSKDELSTVKTQVQVTLVLIVSGRRAATGEYLFTNEEPK
jgi:hypothetical protein